MTLGDDNSIDISFYLHLVLMPCHSVKKNKTWYFLPLDKLRILWYCYIESEVITMTRNQILDDYLGSKISYQEYLELTRDLVAYELYETGQIDVEMYLDLLQTEYPFWGDAMKKISVASYVDSLSDIQKQALQKAVENAELLGVNLMIVDAMDIWFLLPKHLRGEKPGYSHVIN